MNRFHRWYCGSARWRGRLTADVIPWALRDADLGPRVLEVGPGPGLVTDVLRTKYLRIVAVEIDEGSAAQTARRLQGTNVGVLRGDGTSLPLRDHAVTGAVSLTMLHHVPTVELQDRLLQEVHRVLEPGGTFVGADSRWGPMFAVAHIFDTMVLVDPDTFGARLERAGFADVKVRTAKSAFRFVARRARATGGAIV